MISRKNPSILNINVTGKQFEVSSQLFENFPNTVLGNQHERLKYFDRSRNEFFFDRSGQSFEVRTYRSIKLK